jgi:hypothetical protein
MNQVQVPKQKDLDFSQAELIQMIHSRDWKLEAVAFSQIVYRKLWHQADWRDRQGETFVSFPRFCAEYRWATNTAYDRANLARSSRFEVIRKFDITMSMAQRLYTISDRLFQTLVKALEMEMKLPISVIQQILSLPNPTEAQAKRLVEAQMVKLQKLLQLLEA